MKHHQKEKNMNVKSNSDQSISADWIVQVLLVLHFGALIIWLQIEFSRVLSAVPQDPQDKHHNTIPVPDLWDSRCLLKAKGTALSHF